MDDSKMKYEIMAKEFATKKHEGQFRKDEITPYIKHPEAVVGILKRIGVCNDDALAAAWLHDAVEDTDTTIQEIAENFNREIALYVYFLTKTESNKKYYSYTIVNIAPKEVQLIKLADVLHNVSTLNFIKDRTMKKKAIANKVNECEKYYFDLANNLSPEIYNSIKTNLSEFLTT